MFSFNGRYCVSFFLDSHLQDLLNDIKKSLALNLFFFFHGRNVVSKMFTHIKLTMNI